MSVFGPQGSTDGSIEVRSLREGAMVSGGASVSFVLHAEKQAGEELTLEVTLSDAAGKGVWFSTLSSPALEETLELKLPEMDTGQYRLKLALTRRSGPAVEKQVTFFYVTGGYKIDGISSFPPTIQPGSRILLQADLSFPEGADPFIRWPQDGQLLGRGRVSEGLAQVSWQAPQAEGVYPVQVELYPTSPVGGQDFPFSSSLALSAKLYVTAVSASPSDELAPRESYYALFHFDGSLEDAAAPEGSPPAESFGTVTPDGRQGFLLTAGSGIRSPRLLLPAAAGSLAPCTLTLRLALAEGNAGRELLTASGPRFRLQLLLDAERRPLAQLTVDEKSIRLPSGLPPLATGSPHRLDLSLVPAPKTLTVLWFLDGRQASSAAYKVDSLPLAGEGETVIGGDNGFSGTLSEFGVYYLDEKKRPSVDPAVYRAVMERELGARLVLAEEFEGFYLPDGFDASPEGSARLSGGRLQLDPAAALTLPFFDLSATAQTVLEIAFADELPPGAGVALSWEGEGQAFLDIRPEGKALAGGGRELASFAPLASTLQLVLGVERLTLESPGGPVELALPAPAGHERWLKLGLRSPAPGSGLALDRVLVYLKNPQ